MPGIKEKAWYPGEWLKEQLDLLECPSETVQRICQALGQRAFAAADPWIGAVQALEDYRDGIVNTRVPTMMIDKGALTYLSDGNREKGEEGPWP